MAKDDTPDIAQVSDKNTTGKIDPSLWDEAVAVTGRPNDEPEANTTFGQRAKSRPKSVAADVEKKSAPAKKTTSRKR